jgi:hypothetical protein
MHSGTIMAQAHQPPGCRHQGLPGGGAAPHGGSCSAAAEAPPGAARGVRRDAAQGEAAALQVSTLSPCWNPARVPEACHQIRSSCSQIVPDRLRSSQDCRQISKWSIRAPGLCAATRLRSCEPDQRTARMLPGPGPECPARARGSAPLHSSRCSNQIRHWGSRSRPACPLQPPHLPPDPDSSTTSQALRVDPLSEQLAMQALDLHTPFHRQEPGHAPVCKLMPITASV